MCDPLWFALFGAIDEDEEEEEELAWQEELERRKREAAKRTQPNLLLGRSGLPDEEVGRAQRKDEEGQS
jgi:hypothetical protein